LPITYPWESRSYSSLIAGTIHADFFVIMRYRIINIGYRGNNAVIDIYCGIWTDLVVKHHRYPAGWNCILYSKAGTDGIVLFHGI
jgi:hypothetical protein